MTDSTDYSKDTSDERELLNAIERFNLIDLTNVGGEKFQWCICFLGVFTVDFRQ